MLRYDCRQAFFWVYIYAKVTVLSAHLFKDGKGNKEITLLLSLLQLLLNCMCVSLLDKHGPNYVVVSLPSSLLLLRSVNSYSILKST